MGPGPVVLGVTPNGPVVIGAQNRVHNLGPLAQPSAVVRCLRVDLRLRALWSPSVTEERAVPTSPEHSEVRARTSVQ